MNTTANKLKSLRETKGMSQADCAKALGIDRTTYAKYENGGSVKRNVEKLASFFNVSTDYLLDRPEHVYGNTAPTAGNKTPTYNHNNGASAPSYYDDPDVAEMANRLKDDPDMKILFDASKKLSKNDLQFVIDMVNRMKRE